MRIVSARGILQFVAVSNLWTLNLRPLGKQIPYNKYKTVQLDIHLYIFISVVSKDTGVDFEMANIRQDISAANF